MTRIERLRAAARGAAARHEAGQRPLPDRASAARTRRCSSSPTARDCSSPTSATPRPGARSTGVEFVEVERALVRGVAEHARRDGSAFEADAPHVRRAGRCCATAASTSSARRASSRSCARSRTRTELERDPARGRDHERGYARLAAGAFVGRTERELAWRLRAALHELGADGPGLPDDRRVRRERRPAARGSERPRDREGRRSSSTRARVLDGYARTARARSPPARSPDGCARATTSCLQAQLDGLDAVAPGVSGATPTRRRARGDRRRRARRALRPRPRPRRRPRGPRGADAAPRVAGHARGRERRHGRAGHLPRRAWAGSGSRTSSSCARAGSSVLTTFTKELVTVG